MKYLYYNIKETIAVLVMILSVIVFSSCSSTYKNLVPVSANGDDCVLKFKPHFTRSLYNTQVNILRSHLSGLLFIKEMPDSSTRLLFSTETGFKFFDFAFDKNGLFTVHYILDKMNRKPVIKTLENDFSLLLMNRIGDTATATFTKEGDLYHRFTAGDEHDFYVTDSLCTRLIKAGKASGKKAVSKIVYSGSIQSLPDSVFISHYGIKFNIALKRLEAVESGK